MSIAAKKIFGADDGDGDLPQRMMVLGGGTNICCLYFGVFAVLDIVQFYQCLNVAWERNGKASQK